MTRHAYGVGELLRAWHALSPQGAALERRLAQLLCPELLEQDGAAGDANAAGAGPAADRVSQPSSATSLSADLRAAWAQSHDVESHDDDAVLATDLIRIDQGTVAGDTTAEAFPLVTKLGPLVPVEPLFQPRRARALLGAMAATWRPEGAIDVERAVEAISRGRLLTNLPRRAVRSLRAGVEVLTDVGAAMQPFFEDQAEAIAQLRDCVGRSLVRVRRFEGCPNRGIEAEEEEEEGTKAYAPPARGTLVLVLSDFGAARRSAGARKAHASEWASFADVLSRAGCTAAGLSPYPVTRLSHEVARHFPIIHWDRRTSAGAVGRVRGRRRPR